MVQFKFQFFKFDGICQTVALTLCPLMGKFDGIEPICYSRNVEIAGVIVFQPGRTILYTREYTCFYINLLFSSATLMMDLLALFMTSIMIYHVKTKYTAVGNIYSY